MKGAVAGAAILLSLALSPVNAQVVYSGGAPSGIAGFDIFDDFRSATAFTVTSAGISFDAIRFWGILPGTSSYQPNIYWEILRDASGSPDDASVAAGGNAPSAASSSLLFSGNPLATAWQFDFSTGLQSLGAGTYWLALHDGIVDPLAPDPTVNWTGSSLVWETTNGGTAFQSESISLGLGFAEQGDSGLAFELISSSVTTPEPSSLILLVTGLACAGALRVRRRIRATTL